MRSRLQQNRKKVTLWNLLLFDGYPNVPLLPIRGRRTYLIALTRFMPGTVTGSACFYYYSFPWILHQPAEFAPSYKLDVVFLEQAAKRGACKEVKVALPPTRTPAGVIDRRRTHLFIIVRDVHNYLCDTRLNTSYRVGVKRGPTLGWNGLVDLYDPIYDNIVRSEI